MTKMQFALIKHFKPSEITKTGATLAGVQFNLMYVIDLFRIAIGRRVHLLKNGMTTGKHSSEWHPKGLAVDCTLDVRDGIINTDPVFKAALQVGFKGIGIYWNGKQYSFHFDLRPEYGFWIGVKDKKKKIWSYRSLLIDPRHIPN